MPETMPDQPSPCEAVIEGNLPLSVLRQRQSMSLDGKILMSQGRIREWYRHFKGQVYVAFSGGKDSTALLHLVRGLYPEVPAVFCDTGLEFPEIKDFVKQTENVVTLRPEMSFLQVIKTYGYPVGSKRIATQVEALRHPKPENQASRTLYDTGIRRDGKVVKSFRLSDKWRILLNAPFEVSPKCCDWMKKKPMDAYQKNTGRVPFIGILASEGKTRELNYLRLGCNAYSNKKSTPIAFWTENDIWDYLRKFKVPYSDIYNRGWDRTGCVFCAFGCHLDKEPNRFQRLQDT